MSVVIIECKEISLCSKSYRCNRLEKIYIYELISSLCPLLKYIISLLCCFCYLATITYIFICNVIDIVAYQVFYSSVKVEISEVFVLDYERKFVVLH